MELVKMWKKSSLAYWWKHRQKRNEGDVVHLNMSFILGELRLQVFILTSKLLHGALQNITTSLQTHLVFCQFLQHKNLWHVSLVLLFHTEKVRRKIFRKKGQQSFISFTRQIKHVTQEAKMSWNPGKGFCVIWERDMKPEYNKAKRRSYMTKYDMLFPTSK